MTATLEISLFGTPEIYVNGTLVTNWPSRAAEAVIAYVALAGQPVARTILTDLLWPESEPKQAAANLRTILTRIRRELGDGIVVDRKTVALADGISVDVLQFAELAHADATIAELARAADLYGGPFLEGFQLRSGFPFEEWMVVERERWSRRFGQLLKRLVAHHLTTGEFAAGERFAREWVALDPFDEQAAQQLMWLQLRQGRRTAALQSYEQLAAVLEAELDVTPLAATQAVWGRARRARQIGANNIPAARSTFVGRNGDLHQLFQQLGDPTKRLITLLGMGGMGKTRLAREIGRTIIREKVGLFLDGVWFVNLVAADSLDEMVNRIVGSLNINVRDNRPVREQLLAYLKRRELLLILDNFEQLVQVDAAVEMIGDLLQHAPNVKILITSRERLNLYEEQLYSLRGLSTDDPAERPAVALFLHHASRQNVTLPADAEQSIREICQRLEGVPLGIELAASWIRQLSPSEIHATIVADQDFLQTRYRNIPARQRSLRAVFEHSWGLLSADHRTLFAQLAYFPDTFDVAATYAICGASLGDLRELVGKSLLQEVDGQRFSIHPLLREYGLEKLTERQSVAAKHADYYLGWLAGEFDRLRSTGVDRIADDVPNLRLAWGVVESAEVRAAVIDAISYYWRLRGWYAEKVTLIKPFATADHARLQIRAQCQLGYVYHWLGDYDASARYFERARELTEGEISADRANILEGSGQLDMRRKLLQPAIAYLQEAIAIYRQLDDKAALARALGLLAQVQSYAGNIEHSLLQEAMALPTYPIIRASLLAQFGREQIANGEYAAAMSTFAECEQLQIQLNYALGVASSQLNYAIAATYARQWQTAQEKFAVALVWFEGSDEKFGTGLIYLHLGMIAEAQADLSTAYRHYLTSTHIFEGMGNPFGLALATAYLAGGAALLGRQDALDKIQRAIQLLHDANSAQLFASHVAPLTMGLGQLGFVETAIQLCGFALQWSYTEAVCRRQMEELCAVWRETVVDFEAIFAQGAGFSAEEIVELVRVLG